MFSKSRINEPGAAKPETEKPKLPETTASKTSMEFTASAPKGKVAASILSADLTVVGNLRTTGDIQVEGTVEGAVEDSEDSEDSEGGSGAVPPDIPPRPCYL